MVAYLFFVYEYTIPATYYIYITKKKNHFKIYQLFRFSKGVVTALRCFRLSRNKTLQMSNVEFRSFGRVDKTIIRFVLWFSILWWGLWRESIKKSHKYYARAIILLRATKDECVIGSHVCVRANQALSWLGLGCEYECNGCGIICSWNWRELQRGVCMENGIGWVEIRKSNTWIEYWRSI